MIESSLGVTETDKALLLPRGSQPTPMATKSQLESLKRALSFDRPPLCSGAVSPSPEGFYLYYDKKNPKCVCSPRMEAPMFVTSVR